MARFKKLMQKKDEGKIVYKDGIVDGIVLLSVSELEYVELCAHTKSDDMKSKAIKVVYENSAVTVDVMVKIHYSQCISDVAFKIQEAVRHNVEAMTEYKIASVNVIVNGVIFDDPQPVQVENITTDKE